MVLRAHTVQPVAQVCYARIAGAGHEEGAGETENWLENIDLTGISSYSNSPAIGPQRPGLQSAWHDIYVVETGVKTVMETWRRKWVTVANIRRASRGVGEGGARDGSDCRIDEAGGEIVAKVVRFTVHSVI